ncbi:MAG: anthranilate synthase component I family protein [Planctomycetota bacterium]|nr:MAG: anthranilate synthase component I family protein [Planctomycetota bacterium]
MRALIEHTYPTQLQLMRETCTQRPWKLLSAWPRNRPVAAYIDRSDHDARVLLVEPHSPFPISGPDQLALIERAAATACPPGCLFFLGYELGRHIEPAARAACPPLDDRDWPTGLVLPYGSVLHVEPAVETVSGRAGRAEQPSASSHACSSRFELCLSENAGAREQFIAAVERILEFIRAGDVYQVNLTHRLTGTLRGSPRAFAAALLGTTAPRHGAYLEWTDPRGLGRAIVSASPELFLRFDPRDRSILTRPMKGTRPIAADERELASSPKDQAELNMIVDLMRNDLGRVCQPGSVEVVSALNLERHAESVLQATASVRGKMRPGLGIEQLIYATFPPGSVTGAPKIRAMQIIEELEPLVRGPYCGTIGHIDPHGLVTMNVVIRTALLTQTAQPDVWTLDFPVGAGIVADSDPEMEWEETLLKAEVLLRLLEQETGTLAEPKAGLF